MKRAAALVFAAAAAYAPIWRAGWLWDDGVEITKNPLVQASGGLKGIWMAPPGPDYFPLTTSVEWAEWHLWGPRPLGYHLVSLGLHIAAALLFVGVLGAVVRAAAGALDGREAFPPDARAARIAWLGGFLFAVHPVAVESVAWISELKNTLSLPLLLLCLGAWLDAEREARPGFHRWAALGWFAAAMLAKSSVVMLPAVLLLLAWWRRGLLRTSDWIRTALFFAVSALLGIVTIWFQRHRAIGTLALPPVDWLGRWAGAGFAIVFYARICLWPAGLLAIYPLWKLAAPGAGALVAWLVVGGFFGVCWSARRSWGRHLLLGGGFFVLNLLPILGFVDMAYFRISRVADHFAYIALLGPVGLAAAALASRPTLVRVFAPAVVLALAVLSFRYTRAFRDETSLWTRTLARNPGAWLAEGNLGSLLLGEHRIAEGTEHLERALRLNSDDPTIHNNLGLALRVGGRNAEAAAEYLAAIRLDPGLAEAHSNLGEVLASLGRKAEAVAEFRQASRLVADLPAAHNNLGNAFRSLGELEDARREFARSIELDPGFAAACRNLAEVDDRLERRAESAELYQKLVQMGAGTPEDRAALAFALGRLGRWPESVAAYEQALLMKPDYPEALNDLGTALVRSARRDEAIQRYREAVRLRPAYFEAHYNLGNALAEAGRPGEALREYADAARLEPRDPDVRDNLAATFRALGRESEAREQEALAAQLRAGR